MVEPRVFTFDGYETNAEYLKRILYIQDREHLFVHSIKDSLMLKLRNGELDLNDNTILQEFPELYDGNEQRDVKQKRNDIK